jgi:hypothetical protein
MRDDEKVADKSLPSNISAHCHKEMLSTYKWPAQSEVESLLSAGRSTLHVRKEYFFFYGSTALYGPGPPRFIEASRSHSDIPQSVGLLRTTDQLVAETSTWQHTTLTRDRHPCPRWARKEYKKHKIMGHHFIMTKRNGAVFHSFPIPSYI